MSSLFRQMRNRKITQWVLAYLAGAWLFLEVFGFIADHFGWSDIIVQAATITLGMGLLAVLVVAWFHGEKGHQRPVLIEGVMLLVVVLSTVMILLRLEPVDPSHHKDEASRMTGVQVDSSVAVLPFDNATNDPEQQYFSDGVSDELINALSRLPGIHVAARTSSFQFGTTRKGVSLADIAQQLGVSTLVEGSVRRNGDAVRVTAKLINAASGFQMWSESFDRKLTDIFSIQDDIANAIASALHVQLAKDSSVEPGIPRTASIDAYNLYLLGRFHFEKRTNFELAQAQGYFESAIERDPLYSPAYNGLVDSILLQSDLAYGDKPLEQSISAALPLIKRSLKLDPYLAETHASLGFLRMFQHDLLASEAALLRAIELSPNLSRAWLWLYIAYQRLNEQRKAFETLERAFALDPLSPIVNTNMAAEWWSRGQNQEALTAAKRVIQIAPDGPLGYRRAGRIMRTSGKLAEAVGYYRQSLEVAPDDPNSQLELGTLLVDLGNFEEAEQMLGEQRYLALLASGETQEALSVVLGTLEQRPDDNRTRIAAARTELRAGSLEKVRSLLEPMLTAAEPGNGPLFQPFAVHFWDPQVAALDLVVARMESGDTERGLELLATVKNHFEVLREEGFANPMLRVQEARIHALEGNRDKALAELRKAIAAGWRFWYLDGDPAFKSIQNSREFQSIVSDRNRLVDMEKVKLDPGVQQETGKEELGSE